MNKINCDVNNCSHNKSGVCFSNRVDIGGQGATNSYDTCCGSFLDRKHYSTLTNNTNSNGSCDALICKAFTCKYNENTICTLPSINVSKVNNTAVLYSETFCDSFEEK